MSCGGALPTRRSARPRRAILSAPAMHKVRTAMSVRVTLQTIHRMAKSDAKSVLKIDAECFAGNPYRDIERVLERDAFVLRESDGAVIGFVVLFRRSSTSIVIDKMAVLKSSRGQGLGKLLLCWAEVFAKR